MRIRPRAGARKMGSVFRLCRARARLAQRTCTATAVPILSASRQLPHDSLADIAALENRFRERSGGIPASAIPARKTGISFAVTACEHRD
jgi:hypothetical protein